MSRVTRAVWSGPSRSFRGGLDRLGIAAVSSKLYLDYRVGQNKAPNFAAAPSSLVDYEISPGFPQAGRLPGKVRPRLDPTGQGGVAISTI